MEGGRDLTEDEVWGLQDRESNGYVVLDAHKVCTGASEILLFRGLIKLTHP